MDITITPKKLSGEIVAIPSKSQAHRLLICAALADAPTRLQMCGTSQDIEATIRCLRALGSDICVNTDRVLVSPIQAPPASLFHVKQISGKVFTDMLKRRMLGYIMYDALQKRLH